MKLQEGCEEVTASKISICVLAWGLDSRRGVHVVSIPLRIRCRGNVTPEAALSLATWERLPRYSSRQPVHVTTWHLYLTDRYEF
jgi:hypothetical protein